MAYLGAWHRASDNMRKSAHIEAACHTESEP